MKLTPSQQQGLLDFRKFMMDPNEQVASLTGAAGMGKSHLTGCFLQEMDSINDLGAYLGNEPITNIYLTATTNKAVGVLDQMSYKNAEVATIYQTLGLRLMQDWKTGKEKIVPNHGGRFIENSLIIIDEASYMDSTISKYLKKHTRDCKILLSGDDRQLKSVNEPSYSAFKALKPTTKIELTENMRFDPASKLGQLNVLLRDWVVNQHKQVKIVPNGQDIIFADHGNIHRYLDDAFVNKTLGDVRVVAYQNATCAKYNRYVMDSLGITKPYAKGMQLIVNKAFMPETKQKKLHTDREIQIIGDINYNDIHYIGQSMIPCWNVATCCGYYNLPCDSVAYNQQLNALAKAKDWPELFDLKNSIVDARPDYARTSHKAQGSSHDTVIIDMHDLLLMANNDLDMFIRGFYVAVSRARKRVIIYGYPN